MQPPELKAVITVASSDDRYADDVHYMGGALLTDNLSWASTMFAYNSCPPDPEIAGEKWKDMWLDRLAIEGWRKYGVRMLIMPVYPGLLFANLSKADDHA